MNAGVFSEHGLFVCFEGGEGAGKSTQSRLLRDWLVERGETVLLTYEPGVARRHREHAHRGVRGRRTGDDEQGSDQEGEHREQGRAGPGA